MKSLNLSNQARNSAALPFHPTRIRPSHAPSEVRKEVRGPVVEEAVNANSNTYFSIQEDADRESAYIYP